jgi:hypothetical protein
LPASIHDPLNDGEKVEGRAGEAIDPRHVTTSLGARFFSMRKSSLRQRAWLSQIRACSFGVFGALGTFFIDGCGDRIACEERMSA